MNSVKMSDKQRRKNFKWEPEMIENLIQCLTKYKSNMLYKNLDFDADKVALYREVRVAMAELYDDKNYKYFGPVVVDKNEEKESKEAIKKGCKRIQEKV